VEHNFSVGDSVFLNTKNLPIGYANDDPHRRKLQHPYAGPFKLIERIGDNAFRLDIPTHWPLHDVFNVDRFKRNDVDNSRPILPPPPLRTTKGGKVEFEVDKIIDEKKDEHGMQLYHVLWFGGDTTWEPESHMKQGAKEAVKEFWKARDIEPPSSSQHRGHQQEYPVIARNCVSRRRAWPIHEAILLLRLHFSKEREGVVR